MTQQAVIGRVGGVGPRTGSDAVTLEREGVSGERPVPELRAGRYRVEGLIELQREASTFAAFDTLLERPVLLKELRRGPQAPDTAVLLAEARVLAALRHPNVVTLYGVEIPDGRPPFLVMERCGGTSLEALLVRRRLRLDEALRILRHVAMGLDAIHAAGRFHGDIRPANILVELDRVKIADFGTAALLSTMEAGEVIGTPGYMPPERADGALPERELAARSDVFSFGVVAMELLTGRRLFPEVRTPADVRAALDAVPRASELGGLSRAFDEPLARTLAKSPVYRPKTCTALVEVLERAALGADYDGRPLRILVADDDDDQRALWAQTLALRLRGAQIETVSDGDQAIAAVRTRAPTIAMLDLVMPGTGGTRLVDEIRKLSPETSVFVVTGHGSGAEWRAAKELGVRRFFVKPCEVEDVVGAIRDVVQRRAVAPPSRR